MIELTLETVEAAFEQWRCKRYSRAEPIPESLWSMALGLYPDYKRSKICHMLRLNGAEFKRRLENGEDICGHHGFVEASRDEVNVLPRFNTEIQLTIQGKERALTFCVDLQALGEILPHVGALL